MWFRWACRKFVFFSSGTYETLHAARTTSWVGGFCSSRQVVSFIWFRLFGFVYLVSFVWFRLFGFVCFFVSFHPFRIGVSYVWLQQTATLVVPNRVSVPTIRRWVRSHSGDVMLHDSYITGTSPCRVLRSPHLPQQQAAYSRGRCCNRTLVPL